jgi:hypothetical protein
MFKDERPYYKARREHLLMLRAEGLTYKEIALRLGMNPKSASKLSQLCLHAGQDVTSAIRDAKWSITNATH